MLVDVTQLCSNAIMFSQEKRVYRYQHDLLVDSTVTWNFQQSWNYHKFIEVPPMISAYLIDWYINF